MNIFKTVGIVALLSLVVGVVALFVFAPNHLDVSEAQLQTALDNHFPVQFGKPNGGPAAQFENVVLDLKSEFDSQPVALKMDFVFAYPFLTTQRTLEGTLMARGDIHYEEDKVFITNIWVYSSWNKEGESNGERWVSEALSQALNAIFSRFPVYNLRESKDKRVKIASVVIKDVDIIQDAVRIRFIN